MIKINWCAHWKNRLNLAAYLLNQQNWLCCQHLWAVLINWDAHFELPSAGESICENLLSSHWHHVLAEAQQPESEVKCITNFADWLQCFSKFLLWKPLYNIQIYIERTPVTPANNFLFFVTIWKYNCNLYLDRVR